MSSDTTQLLRIGDLARQTGKTVRAIHLYEELGLLRPATRSSGGFRLYERSTVERLRWIDLLHGMASRSRR
jgi:DNA-binding transcriptional MerR regulator